MTSIGDNYITIGGSSPIEGEGVDYFFTQGFEWEAQKGNYYHNGEYFSINVLKDEGSLMPISEEEARAWQEANNDDGFLSELERTIGMLLGEDSSQALMASAAALTLATIF